MDAGASSVAPAEQFFCSLGSGHFFQALNLFRSSHPCAFTNEDGDGVGARYEVGDDARLATAVLTGVRGIVLRPGLPKAARKFICMMLNGTFEYMWRLEANGDAWLDIGTEFREYTGFDGVTKHADRCAQRREVPGGCRLRMGPGVATSSLRVTRAL